jgi:serine phosphatase RsbU (regulator of sigma subunit)
VKKSYLSFLFFILLYCYSLAVFSQPDKQQQQPELVAADTAKINAILKKANNYYFKGVMDEAFSFANTSESYSRKANYKKGIAQSLNVKSRVLYRKGEYDSSIAVSERSLIIAKELNDSTLQSTCLLNLGSAYSYKAYNNQAIDYYFKGLAIEERLKVQPNLKWYFNNIGIMFSNQKNYPKALEYAIRAKDVSEKTKDRRNLCMIYNNIGWIYLLLDKNDSARYALNKSLQMAEDANDRYTLALCLDNLSQLNIKLKQYDKALMYSRRSYEIGEKEGFKEQSVASLIAMGNIQFMEGKYSGAETDLVKGLNMAQQIKSKLLIRDVSLLLASLHHKQTNFKKAYEYYKVYSEAKDSLLNEENSRLLTEMNTKYTTEKKEKEIELLKKNEDIQNLELSKKKNELDRQRTVSIAIFVGFLLLMIVAILMFSRYRLKKKANDQLQSAFNLIEEKNVLIEKSNLMITDSITYAKRIQDAILPASEDLTKLFSDEFFIFYLPSQIVSGDFYWCSTQQNKIIFVVADCTGHGVPGAFMSMIGNTLLNEIVNERKVTDTKKIAELLDEKIIHALHQHEGSQKYDGMDISICCIDEANEEISFTGAHHAMYAYDIQLQKIKGDAYSIGGAQHQQSKTFTAHKIAYTKGVRLYFLTDGYCDQSGGKANKRFSSKRFETLLNEVHGLHMNDQKIKLEQAFEQWKGTTKQRDDILVVGIKC